MLSGGESRFDYEGKETDDTGLQYFGARYYDSYMRMFTQPDQLLPNIYDPQQLNRFAFEGNNPYTYIDKSGEQWQYYLIVWGSRAMVFVSRNAYRIAEGLARQIGIHLPDWKDVFGTDEEDESEEGDLDIEIKVEEEDYIRKIHIDLIHGGGGGDIPDSQPEEGGNSGNGGNGNEGTEDKTESEGEQEEKPEKRWWEFWK